MGKIVDILKNGKPINKDSITFQRELRGEIIKEIKVWCYKCEKFMEKSHSSANSFECSDCGYEIRVDIIKE